MDENRIKSIRSTLLLIAVTVRDAVNLIDLNAEALESQRQQIAKLTKERDGLAYQLAGYNEAREALQAALKERDAIGLATGVIAVDRDDWKKRALQFENERNEARRDLDIAVENTCARIRKEMGDILGCEKDERLTDAAKRVVKARDKAKYQALEVGRLFGVGTESLVPREHLIENIDQLSDKYEKTNARLERAERETGEINKRFAEVIKERDEALAKVKQWDAILADCDELRRQKDAAVKERDNAKDRIKQLEERLRTDTGFVVAKDDLLESINYLTGKINEANARLEQAERATGEIRKQFTAVTKEREALKRTLDERELECVKLRSELTMNGRESRIPEGVVTWADLAKAIKEYQND